jgi:putative NADH-flavin reductase
MKIVLLGANGRTGRQVLDRALSAGDTVTALVRAKDRLADFSHERLKVRVGSPCDPSVLETLLPGHDVVVSVLGPRWPTKAASAIYSESAAAIVDAMQKSNVNRLLVTSSALLFPSNSLLVGALRRLVPNIVGEARRMEERIRSSSLDWTIARTGFLANGSVTRYRLAAGTLPEGGGSIPRAAVAHFLLTEAKQSSHLRQVVGLCG